MKIDDDVLDKLSHIELITTDDEAFKIDRSLVSGVRIYAARCRGKGFYPNASGSILLSGVARGVICDGAIGAQPKYARKKDTFYLNAYKLGHRVFAKAAPFDLAEIVLYYRNEKYAKKRETFYVECDPLESFFDGTVYSYSNCASIRASGDLIAIEFGKDSKTYHRDKDNDYTRYIRGYSEFLSDVKGLLRARLEKTKLSEDYFGSNLLIANVTAKRKGKVCNMDLVFYNVQRLKMLADSDRSRSFYLFVAKLRDERYYVEFIGKKISFVCDEISKNDMVPSFNGKKVSVPHEKEYLIFTDARADSENVNAAIVNETDKTYRVLKDAPYLYTDGVDINSEPIYNVRYTDADSFFHALAKLKENNYTLMKGEENE